ncbi:hypothetical protein GYH30_005334 [Glycine max]|uniref:non-specific serine/threonine protein kinase n=1 Tax=Glycine max TaxID=3847 RepID=A0A0R0L722_SOYBN|nr:hypothetical protein GYH30_005334 [Glycine max]
MQRLETLNLWHNNLSGAIPSNFKDMVSLTSLNISNNQLEGSYPNNPGFLKAPFDALKNNKGLCGNASGLVSCPELSHNPHGKMRSVIMLTLVLTLGAVFLVVLIVGVSLCICYRRATKAKKEEVKEEKTQDHYSLWSYGGKIVYENIIEATEDFDDKSHWRRRDCICLKIKTSYPIVQRLFAMRRYGGGILYAALPLHMQRGCFRIRTHDQQVTKAQLYRCTRTASVYKEKLPTGQIVAVKKLHAAPNEETLDLKALQLSAVFCYLARSCFATKESRLWYGVVCVIIISSSLKLNQIEIWNVDWSMVKEFWTMQLQ